MRAVLRLWTTTGSYAQEEHYATTSEKPANPVSQQEEELLVNEHPGLMLREDFLEALGITPYRLAKATGLTPIHVSELLNGKRNITPMTSLLLGRFLGMSEAFWLNLQNRHDLIEAKRTNPGRIERVIPHEPAAPENEGPEQ